MAGRISFSSGTVLIIAGGGLILISLLVGEGIDRPFLKMPLGLWGTLILGWLLVGMGVIAFAAKRSQSPEEKAQRIDENDFIVSLRVWLIAAAADGVLRDDEIEIISRNALKYFGRDIDAAFIQESYETLKVRTSARAINEELLSSELPLSQEGIRHTLLGAIYVALFDGELDTDERRVIDQLANVFRLDQQTIDGLIGEVAAEISA
jgi:tellurite resistance protein